MPLPANVAEVPDPLIALYRHAWERVVAEQRRIASDPFAFRRRARLNEVLHAIEREMRSLERPTREWLRFQFPKTYALGVANGLSSVGGTIHGWNTIHREAVQQMSTDLFDNLLGATTFVTNDTKRFIRDVVRDEALQKAMEGRTAVQAARAAQRIIEDEGISAVVYADGSRRSLADYAEMAMRSSTAIAYNRGSLNGAPDVGFWEIFDGLGCGLTFHDDPLLANGLIVDRATAESYPIAHPRCQRSLGPRPDITDATQAKGARPTPTDAQRADQTASEIARQQAAERRAGNRRRRVPQPEGRVNRLAARKTRVRRPLQPSSEIQRNVSDALKHPGASSDRYKDVEMGMKAIDDVHTDGPLPDLPIRATRSGLGRDSFGAFERSTVTTPYRIAVDPGGPTPRLTTAHEIGHFLDFSGMGAPGHQYASLDLPELTSEWKSAVDASDAIARLRVVSPKSHHTYYFSPKELWARSYAQFIAKRSGDSVMNAELDAVRSGRTGFFESEQWADDDFAPIEAAIEDILRKLSWLKT